MAKIKVGDTVMWRGGFGIQSPEPAKIVNMEMTHEPRSKYGWSVDEADWSEKDYIIVILDNDHWAYGEQISPI